MKRKDFILPILIVICIAGVIQFIRSEYVLKLITNKNVVETTTKIQDREVGNIKDDIEAERFLVIYDSKESESIRIKSNMEHVFENIKKEYEFRDISEGIDIQNKSYEGIILTFENLDKIEDIELISNYVENGGKLLFLLRPVISNNFNLIKDKLGITKVKELREVQGIELLDDVLIGGSGFISTTEFIQNSSLDVEIDEKCDLHMISSDKTPLLWEKSLGEGKIIFFNGTMLNEKSNRGLMLGIISLEKDGFIYPIINAKILYIDDFPAPIPQGRNQKIYEQYERDINSFYWDIWWRDILKYTKNYDYKITGLVIESYNNKVKPPFKMKNERNRKNFILFSNEILKSNGEIGIHGYNHQSLAKDGYIKQDLGYNPWESKSDMVKSIQEVVRYSSDVLRDYEFRVYVPPSNILSPEGREAVKEGMPDLKILSAVFNEDYTGDSYVQEFEIADDGILEMPRYTYGYEYTNEQKWYIFNGITYNGVFSHFIHPDDILDYRRNGNKTWEELSKEFKHLLKETTRKFPWLESKTASNGGQKLIQYTECKPYLKYNENSIEIYCDNFNKEYSMILRTKRKIVAEDNLEINKISDELYLLNVSNAYSSLTFESGDI